MPNGDIKSYLLGLYQSDPNAVTPNLLAQIAERESSFMQFCAVGAGCKKFQGPIYGSNGPWPYEGKLTKSGKLHIGLMQVDITKDAAWNWQKNAAAGMQTLDQKFKYVKNAVKNIRSLRPGLPDLQPRQLEDMALVQYGDSPGTDYYGLYYVASCNGQPADYSQSNPTCNGTWQWIVTTDNLEGVEYVATVRSQQ